jgi:hypothetical protein
MIGSDGQTSKGTRQPQRGFRRFAIQQPSQRQASRRRDGKPFRLQGLNSPCENVSCSIIEFTANSKRLFKLCLYCLTNFYSVFECFYHFIIILWNGAGINKSLINRGFSALQPRSAFIPDQDNTFWSGTSAEDC